MELREIAKAYRLMVEHLEHRVQFKEEICDERKAD